MSFSLASKIEGVNSSVPSDGSVALIAELQAKTGVDLSSMVTSEKQELPVGLSDTTTNIVDPTSEQSKVFGETVKAPHVGGIPTNISLAFKVALPEASKETFRNAVQVNVHCALNMNGVKKSA